MIRPDGEAGMSKAQQNRRGFLGLAIAGVAAPAFAATDEPDLVVFNANVVTVDPRLPKAQAFAVKDGRFTAVGGADVRSLAGPRTRTYDAKGMTITPGFI